MQWKIVLKLLATILSSLMVAPSILAKSATISNNERDELQAKLRNRCDDQPHGAFLPMPGSCSQFIMCINGVALANSCGPFYRFNAGVGACVHPELAQCVESDYAINDEDPNGYDSVMPMLPVLPTTGQSVNDIPPHLPKPQTPDEVVFDKLAGDICLHQPNGVLLPKADSCIYYYVCLLNRPYRRSCPPMMHFNAEKRLCQDPAHAKCAPNTQYALTAAELAATERAGSVCIGMPEGILLPHESDCEKFYNCKQGERVEMQCPDSLHFSIRHQRCEWSKLARCSV